MFVVEKFTKNIILTRGDSAELVVSLTDNLGIPYEIQNEDIITFSMKQNLGDIAPVLVKVVRGTNVFNFVPSDTANLPFGKYLYDIQLTTASGEVYTVITPSNFMVGEEITE